MPKLLQRVFFNDVTLYGTFKIVHQMGLKSATKFHLLFTFRGKSSVIKGKLIVELLQTYKPEVGQKGVTSFKRDP